MSNNTAPSEEGLDELVRDLHAEPMCLGDREAWQSYTFSLNPTNRENSQSGRWRCGSSTEVATVRLFGWVHDNSMLGPYGSMERSHVQWFNPTNMAKSQKQLLVLYLPPEINSRSIASRLMNIQARNLYYILRTKADLPDLDWVMEDETRERSPQNQTHWWITTTEGGTFITLTSKLWQERDTNQPKTGGSLPRNLYTPRSEAPPPAPSAKPSASSSSINDYTMATWPNPQNYKYSRDPEARKYRLAPLDALDENDNPVARVNPQNVLQPGTAVVVDVTPTLWRIKDTTKGKDDTAPATWTDTFQLIMQQIKVVKPAPDPYADAVYMEDLGPEFQPPPTPSNKRRAPTPTIELSPPTKKPLPATPSKVRALTTRTRSPSWPPFSSVVGPSNPPARSVTSTSMATPPAPPPPLTEPDLSQGDEYLLIYDSDNHNAAMEDATDSTRKPKTKSKGKGKGRAK